jgi:hypothetical protein
MAEVDGPEARNPFSGPRADLGRRAQAVDTIIIGVAVVAGLYFGREARPDVDRRSAELCACPSHGRSQPGSRRPWRVPCNENITK